MWTKSIQTSIRAPLHRVLPSWKGSLYSIAMPPSERRAAFSKTLLDSSLEKIPLPLTAFCPAVKFTLWNLSLFSDSGGGEEEEEEEKNKNQGLYFGQLPAVGHCLLQLRPDSSQRSLSCPSVRSVFFLSFFPSLSVYWPPSPSLSASHHVISPPHIQLFPPSLPLSHLCTDLNCDC